MFIANRALSRRTILRGMGATLALPFLDAMVPVFRPAAAATPVKRFGAIFVPLGERRFVIVVAPAGEPPAAGARCA